MIGLRTVLLLVVSVATSMSLQAGAAEPVRKVLLIGIDGCRFDALQAADTPNLDKIIRGGALSTNTSILGPRKTANDTISGPGWSSIYTGVWADKHGVNDNKFVGRNYERYPHFFTLLKKARPEAVTASFADWMPIHEYILSDATFAVVPKQEPKGADGYRDGDVYLAKEASRYLREKNPDAVCVYFGQVDEAGHSKGFHPTVSEYVAAIERVDAHIGELLAALEQRPDFKNEEWLLILTTDHGGRGTGHGDGHTVEEIRQVFLIASGPGVKDPGPQRQTYLVDAVATALTWLGVELDPKWELDGTPFGIEPAAK